MAPGVSFAPWGGEPGFASGGLCGEVLIRNPD